MPDDRPVVANPDFNDIKQDIITYFKNDATFSDYDFTGSSLNVLVDILAYNTHYNNLTANYLVNEMFLDTALMRNNVLSIAKMLNYQPRSAQGAKATITLRIPKVGGNNLYQLPIGSLFTATDGAESYNFYTTKAYSVQYDSSEANGTTKDLVIEVVEGNSITQRFVANSSNLSFPKFDLLNKNIDTTTIVVSVNGAKWTSVTNETQGTTDVNNLSTIYFIEETRDLTHRIMFGNGVLGKALQAGDEVLVSYIVTNGSEGNGISTFTPAIAGRTDITIVSTVKAQGGGAIETIQEIKDNAPNFFQAQFRAVTENDYKAILKKEYADIQALNVYGGETVGKPGKVFFSIKPKSGDKLTDQAKLTITRDILSKFNLVTVTPQVVDPQITRIIAKTIVQYDSSKLTTSKEVLEAKVLSLYNVLNTTYIGDFLESFSVSKLTQEILALDKAIVSANPRINLRFDVNAENRLLDNASFSFNNKLFTAPFAGEASVGGVINSTLFQRSGRTNFSKFVDDGKGVLRLVDVIGDDNIIVNTTAGTVDYQTGEVNVSEFDPEDGKIGFIAIPDSFDVLTSGNYLLQISVGDSTVTAIDKDDTASLNLFNASRAK
tara:strand:+ start:566 stop:2380 length:1815 start_codon:yes stop_codon:yes gene_type:complete